MISYDDTMRYLPMVMRRLRLRAGHKTQTSALRAIRRNTGVRVTAARISEWESSPATRPAPVQAVSARTAMSGCLRRWLRR